MNVLSTPTSKFFTRSKVSLNKQQIKVGIAIQYEPTRDNREADLRLCFRLFILLGFPCGGSYADERNERYIQARHHHIDAYFLENVNHFLHVVILHNRKQNLYKQL